MTMGIMIQAKEWKMMEEMPLGSSRNPQFRLSKALLQAPTEFPLLFHDYQAPSNIVEAPNQPENNT